MLWHTLHSWDELCEVGHFLFFFSLRIIRLETRSRDHLSLLELTLQYLYIASARKSLLVRLAEYILLHLGIYFGDIFSIFESPPQDLRVPIKEQNKNKDTRLIIYWEVNCTYITMTCCMPAALNMIQRIHLLLIYLTAHINLVNGLTNVSIARYIINVHFYRMCTFYL